MASEAAAARRRDIERHFRCSQRLQPAREAPDLGLLEAGADAAGIDQASTRIVIGGQQGAEKGPRAFGIGPADHEANPDLSNSAEFTNPARCQADSIMD